MGNRSTGDVEMPLGLKKVLQVGFEDALGQVPEALKAEGFGVLTEILAHLDREAPRRAGSAGLGRRSPPLRAERKGRGL